jgi:FkbM family methyltransferase
VAIIHPIGEAQAQNLCRVLAAPSWEPVAQSLTGGEAMRTYRFGQPLVLLCGPDTAALQLLRHGWSGTAAVTVNGIRQIIPLSFEDGVEQISVELPKRDGAFEVTIESLPIEGRDPARCEIWLLGLIFRPAPLALARSVRLNAGTKLIYGEWGEFLALAGDNVLPDVIARDGVWAPEDVRVFRNHVRPGDVVIDVGANIGHHAMVFSKLVGAEGLVVAIEAQRMLYQLVQANTVLNRRANIIPVNAAAGDAQGSVTMYPVNYDDPWSYGTLSVNVPGETFAVEGEEVPVHRLDALLPQYLKGRPVRFVKIDVQAYELFVLRGMTAILASDRPTIFIEISPFWMRKFGYEFTEIYELLRGYGYQLIHREGLPLGSQGWPDIPEDSEFEWDLLAVHPERRE